MKIIVNSLCLVFLLVPAMQAQEAVEAYAQGENTYIRYTHEPYDAAKHYTVIMFSPEGKKAAVVAGLTQVAEVIVCEWKTPDKLNTILDEYHIEASVQPDHTLLLDGPDYRVSTTSEYACLVLVDEKIQMLCCGQECTKRLTAFFPITGKQLQD